MYQTMPFRTYQGYGADEGATVPWDLNPSFQKFTPAGLQQMLDASSKKTGAVLPNPPTPVGVFRSVQVMDPGATPDTLLAFIAGMIDADDALEEPKFSGVKWRPTETAKVSDIADLKNILVATRSGKKPDGSPMTVIVSFPDVATLNRVLSASDSTTIVLGDGNEIVAALKSLAGIKPAGGEQPGAPPGGSSTLPAKTNTASMTAPSSSGMSASAKVFLGAAAVLFVGALVYTMQKKPKRAIPNKARRRRARWYVDEKGSACFPPRRR